MFAFVFVLCMLLMIVDGTPGTGAGVRWNCRPRSFFVETACVCVNELNTVMPNEQSRGGGRARL